MAQMQVLDNYLSIDNMLTDIEKHLNEKELDEAGLKLSSVHSALVRFCTDHLVASSGLAYESAVKLNTRLSQLIIQIEAAKKDTAQVLRGQVSNRKKISVYRNI